MKKDCSGNHPLVLVAEDEAVTRMSLVSILRENGYSTVEATSGPGAMLALEDIVGISLLVTDIDMPAGFDGITLAACVKHRWPSVGIVMTSGKVRPRAGDVPVGALFVPKPYEDADIMAAIHQVMLAGYSPASVVHQSSSTANHAR